MLTRAEQDLILRPITVAYRLLAGPTDPPNGGYRHLIDDVASFRAALRLDDPALGEIIASGTPLVWSDARVDDHRPISRRNPVTR